MGGEKREDRRDICCGDRGPWGEGFEGEEPMLDGFVDEDRGGRWRVRLMDPQGGRESFDVAKRCYIISPYLILS